MRIVQSAADSENDIELLDNVKRAFTPDHCIETVPLEILHDQVGIAAPVAEFVDGDNIRVLKARGRLGLAEEAANQLRIVPHATGHFDSDESTEVRVLALINHTHPTSTQNLDNVVLADFSWC